MEGRGRKSVASLSIVAPLTALRRIEPPQTLSATQIELWQGIVSVMPGDWWNDSNTPLLSEYVRAVDMTNRLAVQIETLLETGEPEDIAASLDALLKMRDRESKRAMSLCTKMRLSQQSSYNALSSNTAKKHAGASTKPWEFQRK